MLVNQSSKPFCQSFPSTQGNNKTRASGIELLRILAALMVIVLHYFNGGIGGATNHIRGTLGVFISKGFLSVSFCAVDLFVMISAYYLFNTQNRKCSKIISLFFEAAIMRTAIYLINVFAFQSNDFSITDLLSCAICIGYYLIFYSIIYITSPLINKALSSMSENSMKRAVITLFIIFSVLSFLPDLLNDKNVLNIAWLGNSTITNAGSFEGYTIINFFLCYVVGAYLNKIKTVKTSKAFLILLLNTFIILAWSYFDWKSAFTYNNPLVIIEAALFIMLFRNFQFKSKMINELAKAAFTCYLIHSFFFRFIYIQFHASLSWYTMTLHVIATIISIYFVCYAVYKIYSYSFGKIIKRLSPLIDKIKIEY